MEKVQVFLERDITWKPGLLPWGLSITEAKPGHVRIRSVKKGSVAERKGLKAGDVLLSAGVYHQTQTPTTCILLTQAHLSTSILTTGTFLTLSRNSPKKGRPKKSQSPQQIASSTLQRVNNIRQDSTYRDQQAAKALERWHTATPQKRAEANLQKKQRREERSQAEWEAEQDRVHSIYEAKSPEEKEAYRAHNTEAMRFTRSHATAEREARENCPSKQQLSWAERARAKLRSPTELMALRSDALLFDLPRNRRYTAAPAPALHNYNNSDYCHTNMGYLHRDLMGVMGTVVRCTAVGLGPAEGGERPLLAYDSVLARELNSATTTQEIHDEMLTPPSPIEGPIVRHMMDWLGELVGQREDLVVLPTEHFSMGNPAAMPRLPDTDFRPPNRPKTYIVTVYIGTGTLGHYVTMMGWRSLEGRKVVHVFDSLHNFTLKSGNTGLYREHLGKVGATLLGLDSTEGLELLFHAVQQQSSGNSCAAFAVLYAVALCFHTQPRDLRVSEADEQTLRRRLHDFNFGFRQGGAPSLTPLRRALEAATRKLYDDDQGEMVHCPMCPQGQGLPIDLNTASADTGMASVSLSDDDGPEPPEPPLAMSHSFTPSEEVPQPKRKNQKRTERVRKTPKIDLGSAFLLPLKRKGCAPEEESLCPHCKCFLLACEAGSPSEVKSCWCCSQGELVAPALKAFSADFYKEGKYIQPAFRDAARKLNNMAAMASSGVSGKWVTFGGGTSFVKVQGRIYHMLRNLGEPGGRRPNQLCILSPEYRDEHSRSLQVDPKLTKAVFDFLHATNPLYRMYKSLESLEHTNSSLVFQKTTRRTHGSVLGDMPGRQQNLMPTSDEIQAIISYDAEAAPREVRVWAKGEAADKSISYLDPTYEALSYPLLRPAAEASWDPNMVGRTGRKITQQQYQRQLHLRFPRFWEMGRLGQEALVDAFCRVESERLGWVRRNQATLRMGSREEVAAQLGEDADPDVIAGRRVILPATYTNSPRQMRKLYHDAMKVVAAKGKPTFFVTFTTNPNWPEIKGEAEDRQDEEVGKAPGTGSLRTLPSSRKRKGPDLRGPEPKFSRRPINCPAMMARVFKAKLKMLMKDIREGRVFGSRTVYDMCCIEWQKRGLTHAHILVRMVDDVPVQDIDRYVSARLPGPDEPELRDKVLKHMLHGPCGAQLNPHSPCMDREKRRCTKHFPMEMAEETHLGQRGFPVYRRTDEHSATIRRRAKDFVVGDSFVVPYNPALLLKYDAHINVEYACLPRTVKYLFKYVMKGADRAKAVISEEGRVVDEVQDYESHRMVGACEAAWRIFGFNLHRCSISVVCLTVHEEDRDQLSFDPASPEAALTKTSKLLRYFSRPDDEAMEDLTFTEYHEQYREMAQATPGSIPHPDGVHHVKERERGEVLARLNWVYQGMTERFFLRLILAEFPARSFVDVRTVGGVLRATYHAAAKALGLAQDDQEFYTAIHEAKAFLTGPALRSFFATILMGETAAPAPDIWERCADIFSEDHLDNGVAKQEAHQRSLLHISRLLSLHGRSLKDFGLPEVVDPDSELERELRRYPRADSQAFLDRWKELFNDEQRILIDRILSRFPQRYQVHWANRSAEHMAASDQLHPSTDSGPRSHETLVLLAPGGCGKTAVLRFLSHHLRLLGDVVVCSATTGIAATNLPGGLTAHSAFRLPFDSSDPDGTSNLSMGTQRADLLRRASLLVVDEIAMCQRNSFKAFQRLVSDLRSRCLRVVLLCGDFAQIPPVVKYGTKRDVLMASVRFCPEWASFPVLRLCRNMRAVHDPEYSLMTQQLGLGTAPTVRPTGAHSQLTPLPLIRTVNSREQLIQFVYPDLSSPREYIGRALLSGTNEAIDAWNAEILGRLPGEEEHFLSVDSGVEEGTTNALQMSADTLAAFSDTGVPPHRLTLKIGAPVILMRNLNFDAALCNSVKGIVRGIAPSRRVVVIEVPKEGEELGQGTLHAIPRICFQFSPAGKGMQISRRQFPLRLAFSLTFNKSQGQTLERVGVDLTADVFAHGMLYVVASRVRDRDSIRVLTRPDRVVDKALHALNVVYPELVDDAPQPLPLPTSTATDRPASPEFHGAPCPANDDPTDDDDTDDDSADSDDSSDPDVDEEEL